MYWMSVPTASLNEPSRPSQNHVLKFMDHCVLYGFYMVKIILLVPLLFLVLLFFFLSVNNSMSH